MELGVDNLPSLFLAAALTLLLVALLVYARQVAQPAPAEAGPRGPRTGAAAMEAKILLIFGMLLTLGALCGGYALREPARQADAREELLNVSIGRGIGLYTSLCFNCHGEAGQGAVVPDVEPMRLAPPLNREDLRPEDPDERQRRYDFIYKVIQRGRPGTPMPAWGQTDGGTLFGEQINELTLMILNGERVIEYEGREDTVWGHVEHVVEEHVEEGVAELPRQPEIEQLPFFQALTPDQQQGARLVLQRGCGSCHIIPNIPGAAGTVGPSLENIANRPEMAGGVVPNRSVQDLAAWIENPQALKPGTAMPNLGLTAEQSLQIAEFLYALTGS